ncbi:MAG: hypothetical protein HQP61_09900 [Peptococcaceae bacterium]|nr:hypothetical protein [Candidatus Syntrophopropionicum ammoniitolerans]
MGDHKGFTIIETMIAAVIFFLVLSAALYVGSNLHISFLRDRDRIEVQENMRIALKNISRSIRQAADVTAYNDAQIVLVPSEDSIRGYRHDPKQREAKVNVGGVYLPISSYIQCLQFDYDAESRLVTITIKGEKGHSGITEMSTKVRLRVN